MVNLFAPFGGFFFEWTDGTTHFVVFNKQTLSNLRGNIRRFKDHTGLDFGAKLSNNYFGWVSPTLSKTLSLKCSLAPRQNKLNKNLNATTNGFEFKSFYLISSSLLRTGRAGWVSWRLKCCQRVCAIWRLMLANFSFNFDSHLFFSQFNKNLNKILLKIVNSLNSK